MRQRRKPDGTGAHPPTTLMKRPLFTVGMSYGGCMLAATLIGAHAALAVAVAGALLFLLALAIRRTRYNEPILAALLAAVAAFCVFAARDYLYIRPLRALEGQTVTASVRFQKEVTRTEKAVAYTAAVTKGELPKDTRLFVWVGQEQGTFDPGDCAAAPLYLSVTDEARDDGVCLTAWAVGAWEQKPESTTLLSLCERWRQWVIDRVDKKTGGEPGAVLRALCLGDKSELSADVRDAFADAGLPHQLVVSGFHMTLVVLGLWGILRFCGVGHRTAAAIALPMVGVFAALTGFGLSALRAGAACAIVLAGKLFRRPADGKNSLGCAVLLILLFDPDAVWDLGFRLSVAATWGILLAVEWLGRPPQASGVWRLLLKCRDALLVTLAAMLATLPFTALTFGRLAVLAPVSNLLTEPLVSAAVACGCVGTLFACLPGTGFLASALFLAAECVVRVLLRLVRAIASLPFAVWALDRPYLLVWACALPFLLWFARWACRGRGLRLAAVAAAVTLAAAVLLRTAGMQGVTTVVTAPMPNGTALLVTCERHRALVLTGRGNIEEAARFLTRQGIDRLDFVLYTEEKAVALSKHIAVTRACADGTLPAADETLSLWEGAALTRCGDWFAFSFDDTRVLLCPAGGDAADLPADDRQATLLIFDRALPRHVTALSAGRAILCCEAELAGSTAKALPPGGYPVTLAGEDGTAAMTRGRGDLTI